MQFTAAPLAGLMVVDIAAMRDDRGYFARTFCAEEFAAAGLPTVFPQCNISFNTARGTLRGMHWQADPFPEAKLVRCSRGAILDVAIDLRPDSPTFCRWFGVERAERPRTLHPGRFRPRLPDPARRVGGLLPNDRILPARHGAGRSLERPKVRDRLADPQPDPVTTRR
jgi:hypothetical protein